MRHNKRGHGQCKYWSKCSLWLVCQTLASENKSMAKQYVEQREDVYWVAGTRVSLDSIVYAFLEGRGGKHRSVISFPDVGTGVGRSRYISLTALILMPIYAVRRQSSKPCARPGAPTHNVLSENGRCSTPKADHTAMMCSRLSSQLKPYLTPEQYLALDAPQRMSEYFRGEVFAMR